MSARRGFALIAVLWIVIAATALAMAAHAVARQALDGSRNRAALHRARWRAADCLERARATIGESLTVNAAQFADAAQSETPPHVGLGATPYSWRSIDKALLGSRLFPAAGCAVRVEAVGSRIDVNTADEELLDALFAALRVPSARADSLVDALLDWRDADDMERPLGAERAWYAGEQRLLPRNGPIAANQELRLVRGLEVLTAIDSVLGVEPGRISLESAPLRVLSALPGFGSELVGRIAELRSRGQPVPDLIVLGGSVSPAAREVMLGRYADLVRLTTLEPDAWVLTATGHAGVSTVSYSIDLRLVRAGDRAAIVRRRSWTE